MCSCGCVFVLVLNTRHVVETNDTSNFLFGGVVFAFFSQLLSESKQNSWHSGRIIATSHNLGPQNHGWGFGKSSNFQVKSPQMTCSKIQAPSLSQLNHQFFRWLSSSPFSPEAGDAQMGSRILARVAEGASPMEMLSSPWFLKGWKLGTNNLPTTSGWIWQTWNVF